VYRLQSDACLLQVPWQVLVRCIERCELHKAIVASEQGLRVDGDVEGGVSAVGDGQSGGGGHDDGVLTVLNAEGLATSTNLQSEASLRGLWMEG
jgi:hypothetical protein